MNYTKASAVTVAESNGIILGKRIAYRLVRSADRRPIYRMEISFGGEVIRRDVACDLRTAAYLYDLVVKNLVTPCTLDDVLEDNTPAEKENFVK